MEKDLIISELKGKLDLVLTALTEMKEKSAPKVYSTDDLVEYLRVGKGTIEKLRQNGDLAYPALQTG